jgi:hypothetical protein
MVTAAMRDGYAEARYGNQVSETEFAVLALWS